MTMFRSVCPDTTREILWFVYIEDQNGVQSLLSEPDCLPPCSIDTGQMQQCCLV